MRLAFMGTPDFAVPTLDALLAAGHDIAAVYSQQPRPAGRGKSLRPSPVQQRSEAAGIEVRTPLTLRNPEAQEAFRALKLDAAVVAAYGLILPLPVLDAPRHGCLNVHASLLPRWRGAAPIQRAILAGDERTGITIMQMERGLDTGPMLAVRETPILGKTAGELTAELAQIGGALMAQVLERLSDIEPVRQPDGGVTYAPKIEKSEARLDFSGRVEDIERQVRAFNPAPGAWFEVRGERIKLLECHPVRCHRGWDNDHAARGKGAGTVVGNGKGVVCKGGYLGLHVLQRAGRAPMHVEEFLRGFALPSGTRLG
jgi:methionyl-tRNA formyltransferase